MATTSGEIRHLWTHKTQDHPWLADEELVIDRAADEARLAHAAGGT